MKVGCGSTTTSLLPNTYGARFFTECRRGNLKKVKELAERVSHRHLEEILVNQTGASGYTALHEVVANGRPEVLQYLLERGGGNVLVNCRTFSGSTPLHVAAAYDQRRCAEILLEHRADIYFTDMYGKTAKETANGFNSVVKLLHSEGIIMTHACL